MFIKLKRVIDLHQEIVTINNVYMPEKNIFTKFENHLSSLLYKIEFICTYFGYFGVISKVLCCDICSVKKISLIYFIQSHCLVTGKVRSSIPWCPRERTIPVLEFLPLSTYYNYG